MESHVLIVRVLGPPLSAGRDQVAAMTLSIFHLILTAVVLTENPCCRREAPGALPKSSGKKIGRKRLSAELYCFPFLNFCLALSLRHEVKLGTGTMHQTCTHVAKREFAYTASSKSEIHSWEFNMAHILPQRSEDLGKCGFEAYLSTVVFEQSKLSRTIEGPHGEQ
jgi:hypothetical protein